jgi:SSS family solute:Na+ symporter
MMTTGLDYLIILLYFAIVLGVGLFGSRLAKSSEDYLVAGRNLPIWIYVPGLASVVLGGGATFGVSKLGFEQGISAAWLTGMYGFGIMAMGFLLSSKISNLRVFSISEMLEVRYTKHARYISASISAFYTTMIAVVNTIAIGTIVHSLLGWSFTTSILVGGGIALIYTIAGGMCSIFINDVIQFVLMTVGIFFVLVPLGVREIGGFTTLTQKLDPSFLNPVGVGWETIFSWFLLFFLGIMIGQDIWQRVFTAKNNKVAKRGSIIAGVYIIFWAMAMALVGVISFVLMPDLANGQESIPRLAISIVPTGLLGLVLAGLLSALLSSVSGTLLASSTLIYNDLVLPFIKRKLSSKQEMYLTRLISTAIGLCVLLLAITVRDVLVALDIAYAILSGSIFVPVLAGFLWKRATWQGAMSSMFISIIVITICIAVFGSTSTKPIIYGMLTSAAVLFIVSLLTSPHPKESLGKWEKRISGGEIENF